MSQNKERISRLNANMRKGMLSLMALTCLVLLGSVVGQAETVTGTLRYQDSDGIARPIAHAKVEIWRYRVRTWPFWSWGPDATVSTDGNGQLSVPMSFAGSGVLYGIRVFATNYAAVVWPNDVVHTIPFYAEPQSNGQNRNLRVQSPNDTLDFSFDFADGWSPQHFNLAETVRRGFDYANARRDPSETDPIPQANVQPTSASPTGTYYNPAADTLVIESSLVFDDLTVLHEYAHFLEEQISSFAWIPANHNGCETRDAFGNLINSAEHAWMEGFADYYAQAVTRSLPPGTFDEPRRSGTPGVPRLETPGSCMAAPHDRVENAIAASLWDLFDDAADLDALRESHDSVSRKDREIFMILDRELDVYGKWPTIHDFRRAWIARSLDRRRLDPILIHHEILAKQTADLALTGGAGWNTLPIAFSRGDGTFSIHNKYIGDFAAWSATPGVVKLEGDFNGDGWQDIALTGGAGWNTVPVAFSNGNGEFTVTNKYDLAFHGYLQAPQEYLKGDFNGDGKTDYAIFFPAVQQDLPVALSNGDGTFWRVENVPFEGILTENERQVMNFVGWAATPGVEKLTGDFNGDGRTDIALVGGQGWTTVPVAFSTQNGIFNVANIPNPQFASWASQANVTKLVGDFNGDGTSDILLTGNMNWTSVPIAFFNRQGTFYTTNNHYREFAYWASLPEVTKLVGDFNGDDKTDVMLTGHPNWMSLPVAFSQGGGYFSITNNFYPEFAHWSSLPTVTKLTGDFNNDGKMDVMLTGHPNWMSMPIAFSSGNGNFFVTNHTHVEFAHWAALANVTKLVGNFD